jgi:hypothetical protein
MSVAFRSHPEKMLNLAREFPQFLRVERGGGLLEDLKDMEKLGGFGLGGVLRGRGI